MSTIIDYNTIPYPNLSHIDTHPSRLAMLATLMGMSPAPPQACRVLEIGCASGGNLIPMAANLPDSTFVGIDLSATQINRANTSHSLSNIRFHQLDIMDVAPDFGEFDYIIAHGVYSWIPTEVRDRLLAICRQHLAPQGIAYISYNTLPGWHNRLMIREMMQYHMRDMPDVMDGFSDAMRLIHFLHDAQETRTDTIYKGILEAYLQSRYSIRLSSAELATSVLHDELEANNQPVYFHQFADHADRHQLQYVAEALFHTIMPTDLSEEVITHLNSMSRNIVEHEQYMDFIKNRTFRQSLLCHEHITLDRTLRPERIHTMLIGSRAQQVEDENLPPAARRFSWSAEQASIATDHPLTIAALQHLIDIHPQVISFESLLAAVCDTPPDERDRQILAATLLRGFSNNNNLVELHTHIPEFTTTVSERPCVYAVARHEAKTDKFVTNMRHECVELDKMLQLLLPYIDGSNTHADLLHIILNEVINKIEITLKSKDGEIITDPDQRQRILAQVLDNNLQWLARAALLIN